MIRPLLFLNLIFFRETVASSCSLDWSLSVLSLTNSLSESLVCLVLTSLHFSVLLPRVPISSQRRDASRRLTANTLSPYLFKCRRLRFRCSFALMFSCSTNNKFSSLHMSCNMRFVLARFSS